MSKARVRDRRRGLAQLLLAGQVNHVVGEVELHFVKREVRERDILRVNGFPIAVAEHGRSELSSSRPRILR